MVASLDALTLEDKVTLLSQLSQAIEAQLETVSEAQRTTQSGATHEEARPENDKDTRAIESTYLARGLAERVAKLETGLAAVRSLRPRLFSEDEPAALGAIVVVEDEQTGALSRYLLAPAGAAQAITHRGLSLQVITSSSPIGGALVGKYVEEEVELRTPQGVRTVLLTALR